MTGNQIPVVKEITRDWVIGWKAAMPYARQSGELVFMPLICRDVPYGVNDTAICRRSSHGNPPHNSCRCGFNAWADAVQAVSYAQPSEPATTYQGPHKLPVSAVNETMAILRVGLHGDVIETRLPSWGYRAEYQRVADMFISDTCALCIRDATSLGVMNAAYPLPQSLRQTLEPAFALWPLCGSHVSLALHTVKPTDLTSHNNVNVHWGYPASE